MLYIFKQVYVHKQSNQRKKMIIRTATKVVLSNGEALKRKLNPKQNELATPRVRLDPGVDVTLMITKVPIAEMKPGKWIKFLMEGNLPLALLNDPQELSRDVPRYSAHAIAGGRITTIRLTDLGGGLASGDIQHRPLRLNDIESWFDKSTLASRNTIFNAVNYTKPKNVFGLKFEEEITEGQERIAMSEVLRPVFSDVAYMDLEEDSAQVSGSGVDTDQLCSLLDNPRGLRQCVERPLPSGWFRKPQKRNIWVSHSDYTECGYVFRDSQQEVVCRGFEDLVACFSKGRLSP